ncbi:TlpA family protein disulfide reductase [Paenibacillus sp. GSMTC-2017]|uniref:TlpA family protein disulfide reductase n=1 Tax=Paenibacillus sp. GSMTC-2017 TaxID=2794350 RepID=UPI0018D5E410|nr:TlpA disulfide reductase family protein [Paenibacillus sp. GSMTC-2017]MBH5318193.1 TlpA family protein disulfide reductase [Paenibacillus sp. GSMTC-2017]
MKNVVTVFIVAFLFAGLAVYQYAQDDTSAEQSSASADFKPKAGFQAASFALPDLDENPLDVGGKGSKLTFLNFWASWCGPCVLEAPDLQKLHEKYGDKIAMIGVNSTKFDKERAARKFVVDHGFTFPILMDRKGDVTEQYKVNMYPTTFLIDSEGVIRERINGVIPYDEWERLIQKWS